MTSNRVMSVELWLRVNDCQNPELIRVNDCQNPELKILAVQNREFRILAVQNLEFRIFATLTPCYNSMKITLILAVPCKTVLILSLWIESYNPLTLKVNFLCNIFGFDMSFLVANKYFSIFLSVQPCALNHSSSSSPKRGEKKSQIEFSVPHGTF